MANTDMILDPCAGLGRLLIKKAEQLDIHPSNIYYNDHDPSMVAKFQALNIKENLNIPEENITNMDASKKSFIQKFDLENTHVVTNSPYNDASGVKKGGRLVWEISKNLASKPLKSFTNVTPWVWQIRQDCGDLRELLVERGLYKVKHLPPDTFNATILTSVFHCDPSKAGDTVSISVYDIDDVTKYHTVEHPVNSDIFPVVRSDSELERFNEVWRHKSYKHPILTCDDPDVTDINGVEYPYLIGMQKEKLNIREPMRKILVKKAGDSANNPTTNHKFIPCESYAQAKRLGDFLENRGQEFLRGLIRGSSLENWMVLPLIGYFDEVLEK